MRKATDLSGQRFGKLVAMEPTAQRLRGYVLWSLRCDCGNRHAATSSNLRAGNTNSCGCMRHRHGHYRDATHNSWRAMIGRCVQPKTRSFEHYGGRGISVCDRWRNSFESFLADMGVRPEGKSLDRINPDGNYEPGNCRWATAFEQRHNRRMKGN